MAFSVIESYGWCQWRECKVNLSSLNLISPETLEQSFISPSWLLGKGEESHFQQEPICPVCLFGQSTCSLRQTSPEPAGVVCMVASSTDEVLT